MATRIRLQRAGMKRAPFYRVVVADSRSPRDGRFIELVGRYNPRTEPSFVELDVEKVEAWIAKGAQPSEVVGKLLAIAKGEKELPKAKTRVTKKQAAAEAAEEAATAKAAEDAAKAKVAEEAAAKAAAETAAAEAAAAEEAPAEEPAAAEAAAEDAPAADAGE